MIFKKIYLLKECFPESWIRKLPLLLFPADIIVKNDELAAMCITFNKRIILLCVGEKFRWQGLASKLIQRSDAVITDTYLYHGKVVLDVWQKNGFKIKKIVNTPFGKKYVLIREKKGIDTFIRLFTHFILMILHTLLQIIP